MFRWKLFRFFSIEQVAGPLEETNALIVEQTDKNRNDGIDKTLLPFYRLLSSRAFRQSALSCFKRPLTTQRRILFMRQPNIMETFHFNFSHSSSLLQEPMFGHGIIEVPNSTLCDAAVPSIMDDFVAFVGFELIRSSFSSLDRERNVLKLYYLYSSFEQTSSLLETGAIFYPEVAKLVTTMHLSYESRPTAVAVDSHCNNAAVGFADGTVLLLMGDIKVDKTNKLRILPGAGETTGPYGVHFLSFETSCSSWTPNSSEMRIFLTTSSSVAVIKVYSLASYHREVLDRKGGEQMRCSIMFSVESNSDEMFVARDEAIYFFHADGRGPCIAFPCLHSQVCSKNNYILVCNEMEDGEWMIYDMKHKLIAFREKAPCTRLACLCAISSPREIFRRMEKADLVETREIYFLFIATDGSCFVLRERSVRERVHLLMQKRFYEAAVALARNCASQFPSESSRQLMYQVLLEFGIHLLGRGDFESAANQFVEGIHYGIPASKAIKLLCDQPCTKKALIRYLEALHLHGDASLPYTRVLLTCYKYEKLENGNSLSNDAPSVEEKLRNDIVQYSLSKRDARELCELCIDAGLTTLAQEFAWSFEIYDIFFEQSLQKNQSNIIDVFEQFSSLEPYKVLEALESYARRFFDCSSIHFMKWLSNWTCRLFADSSSSQQHWEKFIQTICHLYIDNPRGLIKFFESIFNSEVDSALVLWDVKTLRRMWFESLLFTDSMNFLETEEKIPFEQTNMKVAEPHFLSTLYESTMLIGRPAVSTRNKKSNKALNLLQSSRVGIEDFEALSLAELYGHAPCMEYLYERTKKYSDVGQMLLLKEDAASLLRVCRRHGIREPNLWIQLLQFYASLYKDNVNRERQRFPAILQEAIDALDRSDGKIPLPIIQSYMDRTLSALRYQLEEEEATLNTLESQMRSLKEERSKLNDSVMIIQNDRCSKCGVELTVPLIHFLCGHSYHIDCLVIVLTVVKLQS
ncbi:Vacuolar protein-sorting-associated protein 11 [Galdieria sulphuraria]|nr:Vacuolar protein-sorting-associated protein 11 [Galdieria sulphuraria]